LSLQAKGLDARDDVNPHGVNKFLAARSNDPTFILFVCSWT